MLALRVALLLTLWLVVYPSWPELALVAIMIPIYSLYRGLQLERDRSRSLEIELEQANKIGINIGRRLAETRRLGLKWKNAFRVFHGMPLTTTLEDEIGGPDDAFHVNNS